MNTATQLLEQCKTVLIENLGMVMTASEKRLVHDIEAYLAKQQSVSPETVLEQEPVAIVLNTGTKQGVKWLKDLDHGVHLYTLRY